ncbi:UNVERIFIED_CONTAM: hypothetical protein Sradi_6838800 [Sesamum radiatum]|uniref:DUF4283 domain-containing protein n=1 Tax=Sesamum radiatum TaxID=300843 RepID=A0AAW2JN08_SESRA
MEKLESLKQQWDRRFPDPSESIAKRRFLPRFPPRVNFLPRRSITPPRDDPQPEEREEPQIPSTGPEAQRNSNSGNVTDSNVGQSFSQDVFVGNVKINMNSSDTIADAFLNSTRKTLRFIQPAMQKDEILIRPTPAMVEMGSKKWQATAVGYFLGKKPYFPHLEAFAKSNWKGLQRVSATANGFYFFQFQTIAYMEEIIEEGPWLFQGQPVVLQAWEQGMSLRRQKHNQIPVWIRLRHLPLEYWTVDGLSAVASGVGTPFTLIRLLNYALEKRVKKSSVPVSVFVQKAKPADIVPPRDPELASDLPTEPDSSRGQVQSTDGSPLEQIRPTTSTKGKEIVVYNPFEILGDECSDLLLEAHVDTSRSGPIISSPKSNPP